MELHSFYRRCLAKNLSPQSIAQYRKVLIRFAKLGYNDESTPNDIRCYLSSLDVAASTKKVHWMTLNVYFNFLEKNGLIKDNPMKLVESPKVPKKMMRYFTNNEIDAILNCWDEHTYSGIRNKTIMLVFLSTGIRRAELSNLKIKDIRWDMDCIVVHGKGGKERTVPIATKLRMVLARYLSFREKWMKGHVICDYLFLSVNYRQKLTPAGVWQIFSKSPLTGERVSPHTWRHSMARLWILNGGSLVTLQQILGHSDISTTRKYIYLASEDVGIENERYNPLNNERWKYY